jgi:hypothetical protein
LAPSALLTATSNHIPSPSASTETPPVGTTPDAVLAPIDAQSIYLSPRIRDTHIPRRPAPTAPQLLRRLPATASPVENCRPRSYPGRLGTLRKRRSTDSVVDEARPTKRVARPPSYLQDYVGYPTRVPEHHD